MVVGAADQNHQEPSSSSSNKEEEMAEIMFTKRGCCFWLPCFGSDRSSQAVGSAAWWERIQGSSSSDQYEDKWWNKGIIAFKKVREWSEIVAGPKWKTFIRRFNKNNHHHYHHQRGNSGGAGGGGYGGKKFQYDPLSYALNFEEGARENGYFEEDYGYPDFSSRYASIPVSAKSSMDLGKDGPSFT